MTIIFIYNVLLLFCVVEVFQTHGKATSVRLTVKMLHIESFGSDCRAPV